MKTVEEKNRMIADFIGMNYSKKREWAKDKGWVHSIESLNRFKTDYNWLMPVVEKIKDTKSPFNPSETDGIDFVLSCDLSKENLYNAVCEFIESYNEN